LVEKVRAPRGLARALRVPRLGGRRHEFTVHYDHLVHASGSCVVAMGG
jgi:hypothetical protein